MRVLLGWRARGLVRGAGGFELRGAAAARARRGEGLSAEAVVVALPHERAASLLEPLLGARAPWRGLGSSPIVNLHLLYDRPVLEQPFAAGVRTPVQYVFDRTRAGGAPAGHQYLAVSLSGAAREMKMSVDEIRELYIPALRALLPRTRDGPPGAVPRHARARRHLQGAPGSASLRPPPRGWRCPAWPWRDLDGHRLAGDARERRPQRPRRGG